jgi:hypothetical protein
MVSLVEVITLLCGRIYPVLVWGALVGVGVYAELNPHPTALILAQDQVETHEVKTQDARDLGAFAQAPDQSSASFMIP